MLNIKMLFPTAIAIVAMTCLLPCGFAQASEQGLKQPVFLLSPHTAGYSSWSLYVIVADNDHSKVLSLGLETLVQRNSKTSPYEQVLAAQHNPRTKREFVTALDARDFTTKQLIIDKDNALHVSLAPQADGSFALMLSARVSLDGRFLIGGAEQAQRDLVLTYDALSKAWQVTAKTLHDYRNINIPGASGRTMSGLVFPVTGTGIYMVLGVWDNGAVEVLMDRTAVANRD
jgi:hypothetical protein